MRKSQKHTLLQVTSWILSKKKSGTKESIVDGKIQKVKKAATHIPLVSLRIAPTAPAAVPELPADKWEEIWEYLDRRICFHGVNIKLKNVNFLF